VRVRVPEQIDDEDAERADDRARADDAPERRGAHALAECDVREEDEDDGEQVADADDDGAPGVEQHLRREGGRA
jgi:hypothetical protein